MYQEEKGRFEIKKWYPVAFWSWSLKVEHCAICKNHIMEKCIECEGKDQKEICNTQQGKCGHAYHEHCIRQWLKTKNTCPLDNKQWEEEKKGI
ncbi:unnamed protein product [Paramecium sonneborni]|uniref:RING-type domain-containing protein n=1 Tax=Paramecium sonneborni TaxID=65129 RepID=A0A8S1NMJ9_9CILI|nr:unnamed protein product [Paramecium sonneborni]